MPRANRLVIGLAVFITLLLLTYASLPWVITWLVKQQLAAQGLSAIQLRVDYPAWRSIQLHKLAFTAKADKQSVSCHVPELEITYQLGDLLTGMVTRVRVPLVTLHLQASPGRVIAAPSAPAKAGLPVAGLLSGQWLADIPVRELLLEQVKLDAQQTADTVYTLQLSAQLRDAQLQVNGDLRLPSLPRPLAFSLHASHTGAARVRLSSPEQTAEPMLALVVKPRAADQAASAVNAIRLNGELTARLAKLWSVLMPLLPGDARAAAIEGELNSHWQAQLSNTHWQLSSESTVHGLAGRWQKQPLPSGELTAKVRVDPQRLTLQSTWRAAAQAVVVEAKGWYQFADSHGQADLRLAPVQFSDGGFVLSRLLKNWPYPFDITAGRLTGSARLDWQQALDLQGTVQLDKLGGRYRQVTFTGLSGEVGLAQRNSRGEAWHTRQDAQLHVDVVNVGFPVQNIKAAFALPVRAATQLPLLQVKSLSAALLGGQVRSGPFDLDLGRDNNTFVVTLQHIGLHDIMQLEQQQGLQGSGRLDGQIPVTISNAGIVVKQGQLSAVAPGGYIRYTPTPKVAAMAQSNPGINMVVSALSDFQYHLLKVTSDYKPGGDLALQVHLEGKNPQWQAGQPLHLNLNLEENIPTLLRSLQLSDDITKQVQQRYQKAPN